MMMTAPPVVFVGPIGGYRGLDQTLLAGLLGRGRTVREVDIVLGDSTMNDPQTTIASQIAAAVDSAMLEDEHKAKGEAFLPALVGYSAGVHAVISYAAAHPEVLSSVILIAGWLDPSVKMRELYTLRNLLHQSQVQKPFMCSEILVRSSQLALASTSEWPESIQSSRMSQAAKELDVLIDSVMAESNVELLPLITTPALVIGGRRDEFATLHQSRLIFASLPDARYAEIDCGHLAVVERPAEIVSLLETFIAEPHRLSSGSRVAGCSP